MATRGQVCYTVLNHLSDRLKYHLNDKSNECFQSIYTIYLYKEGTRQVLVEMNYAHFKRSNFDNETNYIKFLK